MRDHTMGWVLGTAAHAARGAHRPRRPGPVGVHAPRHRRGRRRRVRGPRSRGRARPARRPVRPRGGIGRPGPRRLRAVDPPRPGAPRRRRRHARHHRPGALAGGHRPRLRLRRPGGRRPGDHQLGRGPLGPHHRERARPEHHLLVPLHHRWPGVARGSHPHHPGARRPGRRAEHGVRHLPALRGRLLHGLEQRGRRGPRPGGVPGRLHLRGRHQHHPPAAPQQPRDQDARGLPEALRPLQERPPPPGRPRGRSLAHHVGRPRGREQLRRPRSAGPRRRRRSSTPVGPRPTRPTGSTSRSAPSPSRAT